MLTGEHGEGRSFRVSAKWVKEMTGTYSSNFNQWQMEHFTMTGFEYAFNEIDGEIEVIITAGEDWQMLNNQPAWIHEVLPLDEFLEAYEHEKYIEQLK